MRITYLPWEFELWMCSVFWVLILMTWLFWKEVIAGRYDPNFWDKKGDDDIVPREDVPAPHHILKERELDKRRKMYELIILDVEEEDDWDKDDDDFDEDGDR